MENDFNYGVERIRKKKKKKTLQKYNFFATSGEPLRIRRTTTSAVCCSRRTTAGRHDRFFEVYKTRAGNGGRPRFRRFGEGGAKVKYFDVALVRRPHGSRDGDLNVRRRRDHNIARIIHACVRIGFRGKKRELRSI